MRKMHKRRPYEEILHIGYDTSICPPMLKKQRFSANGYLENNYSHSI
jgi:hypothetical protein